MHHFTQICLFYLELNRKNLPAAKYLIKFHYKSSFIKHKNFHCPNVFIRTNTFLILELIFNFMFSEIQRERENLC